jgi:hypothetical protein
MTSAAEIREGMAVFDETGRKIGEVEDLRDGHFFLTHTPTIPLVKERIAVDAAASVASVDADGVHLRHDRLELLARQMRPPESQSSRQVAPGEDASSIRRGDEDRRPLDTDDIRDEQREGGGTLPPHDPMSSGA